MTKHLQLVPVAIAAVLSFSVLTATVDAQQYLITLEFSKHRGCGTHCPDYQGGNFNKKYPIPGYVTKVHDPNFTNQQGAPHRNFRAWKSDYDEVTIDFDQGCRVCKPFENTTSKTEGTLGVNFNYGRKSLDRSTISQFEELGYVLEYDASTDTYHFRPRYPGSTLPQTDATTVSQVCDVATVCSPCPCPIAKRCVLSRRRILPSFR